MEMSEVPNKPRAAPRSAVSDHHHQQRHLGLNTPVNNDHRHQMSGVGGVGGYSSSEGEEDGLTAGCEECEECARNQGIYNNGKPSKALQYGTPPPSPAPASLRKGRSRSGRGSDKHATRGLTTDESHISPIENLDNTIHRLYSYLSGSDGEGEVGGGTGGRRLPQGEGAGGTAGRRGPQRRDQWQRRRTSSSPCSSRSSSVERPTMSSSDQNRTLNSVRTLDSSGTGENVYSKINDTATLPLPHMLGQIPPPPLEDPASLGPAVPPRPAPSILRTVNQQPLYSQQAGNRRTYHELESEFEPQFIRTAGDGTIFIPPDTSHFPNQNTGGGPMSFPRTVPRTASLPRNSQRGATPNDSTHTLSRATPIPDGLVVASHADQQQQSMVNSSTSTDRIKHQLKELEDTWARQNVTFNTNTSLLPHLPTYPSIHNDFRDYSRFSSATYRVKKKLKGKCSWKCTAIVFMVIALALLAALAFCLVLVSLDLNWKLEKHQPLLTDLTPSPPPGGTWRPAGAIIPTSESVITVVQYPFGKRLDQRVLPGEFWRTQFYLPESNYVKFNFTIPSYSVMAVYGRRSAEPTHAQHDFMEVLDGTKLGHSRRNRRGIGSTSYTTAFLTYMEAGVWYVYIYNDMPEPQDVTFIGDKHAKDLDGCEDKNGCSGHGDCVSEQCECYEGYTGWDCSQRVCPVLCGGNGVYVRGLCQCFPGWKGTECLTEENQCEDPTCHGNGKCLSGKCVCSPGYTGPDCEQATCLDPECSGHGVCLSGACQCFGGYRGRDCSLSDPSNVTVCVKDCSGHGTFHFHTQACVCDPGWYGVDCHLEVCKAECVHGMCRNQRCDCEEGWIGTQCDLQACHKDCNDNGYCNNGTCVCKPGWNGRYCSLDGCPNSCNNNGACHLFRDGWICSCRDGWKGKACSIPMENECNNAIDDDGDGLPDCLDPDCCMVVECSGDEHCKTSPDPMEILLRKQPPSNTASFYDRMRFLVEDDSVQSFARLSSFNVSQVSVIRGKVVSTDGSPLIGVRVSVVTQPLYGFTLTRELGLFDILVNGGGSVTLQFLRQPYSLQQTTVMVPWNLMVTMDTVTLVFDGEDVADRERACIDVSHDHYTLRPVVISTWQHTQLGACTRESAIIPESQVLQESLQIPATDVYLVYHSSEAPGYTSIILIRLTPPQIPDTLAVVHLKVTVEGLTYERTFEADVSLKHTYAWDRRNAYNQKVYGIVTAQVHVGYQYVDCEQIYWHTQAATMSGYDITSSEIGGWNLHIHHTYNFQEGILHRGDGTNIYLKERPRKIVTILGTGRQRRLDCRNCDGGADSNRLMAPVALASGRDGSLYIGDFNYIRKMNGEEVATILELDMPEVAYKYFMTVSPLDGRLYISDSQAKQIILVKTMGAVRVLDSNKEVIAGSGQQCYPGDDNNCGDGGPATDAKLFYPKGIAINKDGVIYFADGANIRMIDKDNIMHTVIGQQGQPKEWKPMPCEGTISVDQVTLHWPTALAINPLDDTLHILDNNMVLKLTKDHSGLLVVAGYPLHCPPLTSSQSPLLDEQQSAPKLATAVTLKSPQHITFSPNAELYIVESDAEMVNRIRRVDTDGTIAHYAGAESMCNCRVESCICFDKKQELATKALLNNPTAITVTPDNVLHVADMGNLRIHSIVSTLPTKDRASRYEILQPETQELFVFNVFGQHIHTKNLVTDQYVYNFTYNVNSYYGKLSKVTDNAGNTLSIVRDYTMQAKEILPPGGAKCHFTMDNMGQLESFTSADNATTSYTYLSNTGLLETKKTSAGLVFVYEYNENGRLAEVIQPTGERTVIATDVDATGALARLATEHTQQVAMATHGNLLSILHGQSHIQVSYLRDGSLIVEYPFNMAVTMETSPHPLLSTEHQLHVKRKLILPDALTHKLEWRYYLKRDRIDGSRSLARVGRRMRVGMTASGGRHVRLEDVASHPSLHDSNTHDGSSLSSTETGYEGKALVVNGEIILHVEYDRELNSESVYNLDKEEILLLQYDPAGQLIQSIPTGPVQGVNISYNSNGQMVKWNRGPVTIDLLYDDKHGQLIEKRYGSRALYRYIYKTGTKPTDAILPSGKQYEFHYDHHGNLRSIVTPSLSHHKFHSLASLGVHRLSYHPPASDGQFLQEYDSNGRLKLMIWPSEYRRVTYYYNQWGQAENEFHDWTDITYGYYPENRIVQSVNVTERFGVNFECALFYGPNETFTKYHQVLFKSINLALANAKFMYVYDAHLRIATIEAIIGSQLFAKYNFTYDAYTGRIKKIRDFEFSYPRMNSEMIRDTNIEIIREYDAMGHLTDVWYKFNNNVKYTLEVKHDSLDRLQQWRRKVGTSDLKAYEYVYDIDGNPIEVLENGQTTWRYEIDESSNIEKITHHSKRRELEINSKNQLETDGEESYMYDKDGFLIQRGNEVFEYDSKGHLTHSFEPGKYDIYYYYDGLGRLVVRRDILSGYITQYYYADVYNKDRITHIYEHGANEVSQLHYDGSGLLFAMQRNQDWFYFALDPMGSPTVIFNSIGSVVKQMVYDPLGGIITSSPADFIFDVGFQGGIRDPVTKLVFLKGRVYDPANGRWTGPDYQGFMGKIEELWENPEATNHYLYKGVVNGKQLHQLNLMTDIPDWLNSIGYDMESLIPKVNFKGQLVHQGSGGVNSDPASRTRLVPISSAFECAFKCDMDALTTISTVPRSQITVRPSERPLQTLEPLKPVLGEDILLSRHGRRVVVDFLERPDENMALLASTLLNSSDILDTHFTIHGRDVHYFVKGTLDEAQNDAKVLALKPSGDVVGGINITIHRHHQSPETMLHADYRLHGQHTVLNVRYGTTVEEERDRVLTHAVERAIEKAWLVERELVQSHKQSINTWTQQQKDELFSKGSVTNVRAIVLRDISKYPELADDPKNIRFVPERS